MPSDSVDICVLLTLWRVIYSPLGNTMPRNRLGAKALRDMRTHPLALNLLTLLGKIGKNS